jgi:hypothetical protein
VTARVGPPAATPAPHSTASPASGRDAFARALDRAAALVDSAGGPGTVPAEPLDGAAALRLQLSVYRRAEQLELASRVLDSGVSAVKTILQTRV